MVFLLVNMVIGIRKHGRVTLCLEYFPYLCR